MSGSLNGKTGEWVRWLLVLAFAAISAHFTADRKIAVVDTREEARFAETQRSLARIESAMQRVEGQYQRVLEEWRDGVDRRTGEPLPLQRSLEHGR